MATWGDLGTQLVVSGGGVALVLAAINAVSSRRVTRAAASSAEAEADDREASASQKLVDTAVSMLKPYQEQLNDLRSELAEERAERVRLRAELADERARLAAELADERVRLAAELAAKQETERARFEAELAVERSHREESDRIAAITAQLLADHVLWDLLVIDTLRAHGITVIDPPPLPPFVGHPPPAAPDVPPPS